MRKELTQDILMVNDTIIPTSAIKSYRNMQPQPKQLAYMSEIVQETLSTVTRLTTNALNVVGIQPNINPFGPGDQNDSLLGKTYHTLAAIR